MVHFQKKNKPHKNEKVLKLIKKAKVKQAHAKH